MERENVALLPYLILFAEEIRVCDILIGIDGCVLFEARTHKTSSRLLLDSMLSSVMSALRQGGINIERIR